MMLSPLQAFRRGRARATCLAEDMCRVRGIALSSPEGRRFIALYRAEHSEAIALSLLGIPANAAAQLAGFGLLRIREAWHEATGRPRSRGHVRSLAAVFRNCDKRHETPDERA